MISSIKKIEQDRNLRRRLGYLLILISVIFGIFALGKDQFVDEHALISTGKLISKGYILYSDIFSHHFPLAYYWVAIVYKLVGNSLILVRFCLLLTQSLLFAYTVRFTHYELEIGLTAVLWGIFRSFYYGNMILYPSFVAAFVVCLVFFTFEHIKYPAENTKVVIISSALLAVMAFFTDPLMVYPIAVICVVSIISNVKYGAKLCMLIALGIGIVFFLLLITGSLDDFWDQAIVFNARTYGRYTDSNPNRFIDWGKQSINLLGIFDSEWTNNVNPRASIESSPDIINRWLFTGFLNRYVILTLTIIFLLRKEWLAAGFIYFFSSSNLVKNESGFRAQPFVILGLAAFSMVIGLLPKISKKNNVKSIIVTTNIVIIALMMAWVCLRFAKYNMVWSKKFMSNAMSTTDSTIETIQNLHCQDDNVHIAAYPGYSYIYWISDLLPVKGYVYMWPWVADYDLQGVINEMSDPDYRSYAFIDKECNVWGHYQCRKFLGPLIDFLDDNYIAINDSLYISPAQYETCRNLPN